MRQGYEKRIITNFQLFNELRQSDNKEEEVEEELELIEKHNKDKCIDGVLLVSDDVFEFV